MKQPVWRSFPFVFSAVCFTLVIFAALLGKFLRLHIRGTSFSDYFTLLLPDIFFYGAVIAILMAALSTKCQRLGLFAAILAVVAWINLMFIEVAGKIFGERTREDAVFSLCFQRRICAAIIQDGWKYIHHCGSRSDELFNLENDPEERHNLISSETGRADRMRPRLLGWLRSVSAWHRNFYEQF